MSISVVLIAGVAELGVSQAAFSASLTTLFSANNGGNTGGAVYFNIETGANALSITGFDTNTAELFGPTAGFEVYTKLGTAQGFEGNIGAWDLESTGTITPSGRDNPSAVDLDNPFVLEANTLYGFALVMPSSVGHDYTNGSGCSAYVAGGNCSSSNGDLSFIGGSASNSPFSTSSPFAPRIWNGTIEYEVVAESVPEPTALLGLVGLGCGLLVSKRNQRKS
ncbi:PEP-CTERM sorting domain-containing protein [Roseofilum capinflatum]|uniref:PEP-CTERM sorting domain-containing protein n=1 Tax=Roseofilum capinflatum BLCC-M114 TaxID=3022440 RepID=A0ABT7B2M4_9CYAN|nr:PEP-CTERM sorting domain-containing protein [Roseofilum capinflatum]MDJ1173417.1 PEP-CTERM sorting domain-containing protein [Roseofilum capinflatum BLCC-M114]